MNGGVWEINLFQVFLPIQFWTSGDVSSGFQSQSGFCLFKLCEGVHNIRSLRFTFGATPLPVYIASIAASHFPHMHVSAEVGCQI